jgi:cytochrome c1
MNLMSRIVQATALSFALTLLPQVGAASGGAALPHQHWDHQGIFGKFDPATLKRGAKVAIDVCMGCHSIKYIKYDHLRSLGYSEAEVKDFAAANDKTKKDPMISGLSPTDANDSYGIEPPDLSLMTKARKGYEDYTYAILVGYLSEEEAGKVEAAIADEKLSPEEITDLAGALHMDPHQPKKIEEAVKRIQNGSIFNKYFPGHFFAMPQPIADGAVEFEDGAKNDLHHLAKDVTAFLAWAAEPTQEQRKSTGMLVMLYLVVLTALLYAVKRRVWAKIKH